MCRARPFKIEGLGDMDLRYQVKSNPENVYLQFVAGTNGFATYC